MDAYQGMADDTIAQAMNDELFLESLRADPEILRYLDAGQCPARTWLRLPGRRVPLHASLHDLVHDSVWYAHRRGCLPGRDPTGGPRPGSCGPHRRKEAWHQGQAAVHGHLYV
jgi:hypothetical protein